MILVTIIVAAIVGFSLFGCSSSSSNNTGKSNKSQTTQTTQTNNYAKPQTSTPNNPDANLTAQTPPENGTILDGYENGYSAVEVNASPNANAYVKVKDEQGNTVVGFFVSAGSTAGAYVPEGTYSVQFAMGDTWYGQDKCFGSKTSYGQDDGLWLDYGDVVTYSLQLTSSGNFSMGHLSASEF
ncbi:MAG: hypothetical protein IKE20_04160 [Eggerthellaceae bacterium]|nr:hypothetical protein [Eggerthellaceae bacterium]